MPANMQKDTVPASARQASSHTAKREEVETKQNIQSPARKVTPQELLGDKWICFSQHAREYLEAVNFWGIQGGVGHDCTNGSRYSPTASQKSRADATAASAHIEAQLCISSSNQRSLFKSGRPWSSWLAVGKDAAGCWHWVLCPSMRRSRCVRGISRHVRPDSTVGSSTCAASSAVPRCTSRGCAFAHTSQLQEWHSQVPNLLYACPYIPQGAPRP